MERNQETSGDKTTTESPMRYKKGGISKYDAEKRDEIKHNYSHVTDHANNPSTKTKDHRKQDTLDKRTYKTNDKPDSSDARKHHSRSKDPEKQDLPDMSVNRFNGRNHVSNSTCLVVSALIFDAIIVFGVLSIVYLTHLSTLKIPDGYMLVQKHVTNTTNQTIEQTSIMTSLTTEAASSTISKASDLANGSTSSTSSTQTLEDTKTTYVKVTTPFTTSTTGPSSSSSAQETTTKIPDCPDNWITYRQSCYLFSNESLIWTDARIRCENLNGYLVEITSADEDQFLVKHANFSTSQINEEECFTTRSYEYSGFKSTTANGITCQRWDSQTPHRHINTDVNKYPENSLADAANYCRDPDRTGKPWCYTIMSSTRWQLCGINRCEKENYWAGMMVIDGLWKWVSTHNTLDQGYTNWGSSLVLGTCGSLVKEINFQWGKGNCNHRTLFICEKGKF